MSSTEPVLLGEVEFESAYVPKSWRLRRLRASSGWLSSVGLSARMTAGLRRS